MRIAIVVPKIQDAVRGHPEQPDQADNRHENLQAQRVLGSDRIVEPTPDLAACDRDHAENDPGDQQIERLPFHHARGQHAEEEQHAVHPVEEKHPRRQIDRRVAMAAHRLDHAPQVSGPLTEGAWHRDAGSRCVRGKQKQRNCAQCKDPRSEQRNHPFGLVQRRIEPEQRRFRDPPPAHFARQRKGPGGETQRQNRYRVAQRQCQPRGDVCAFEARGTDQHRVVEHLGPREQNIDHHRDCHGGNDRQPALIGPRPPQQRDQRDHPGDNPGQPAFARPQLVDRSAQKRASRHHDPSGILLEPRNQFLPAHRITDHRRRNVGHEDIDRHQDDVGVAPALEDRPGYAAAVELLGAAGAGIGWSLGKQRGGWACTRRCIAQSCSPVALVLHGDRDRRRSWRIFLLDTSKVRIGVDAEPCHFKFAILN